LIEKEGLILGSSARNLVKQLLEKLVEAPGFANGRDIGDIVAGIRTAYARRLYGVGKAKGELSTEVTEEDIQATLSTMRKNMGAPPSTTTSLVQEDEGDGNKVASDAGGQKASPIATTTTTKQEVIEKPKDDKPDGGSGTGGGLSDDDWDSLNKAAKDANINIDKGEWRNNRTFEDALKKYSKNSKDLLEKLGSLQDQMQHKLAVQQNEKEELKRKLKKLQNEDRETYRKLKEEKDKKKKALKKLREMGLCPAGYEWLQEAGGWRCAGGSHFVTSEQLGL